VELDLCPYDGANKVESRIDRADSCGEVVQLEESERNESVQLVRVPCKIGVGHRMCTHTRRNRKAKTTAAFLLVAILRS